MINLVNQMTSK